MKVSFNMYRYCGFFQKVDVRPIMCLYVLSSVVMSYYVSLRSEFRVVLFYYVSLRTEFCCDVLLCAVTF
jgi:hypothetical protein